MALKIPRKLTPKRLQQMRDYKRNMRALGLLKEGSVEKKRKRQKKYRKSEKGKEANRLYDAKRLHRSRVKRLVSFFHGVAGLKQDRVLGKRAFNAYSIMWKTVLRDVRIDPEDARMVSFMAGLLDRSTHSVSQTAHGLGKSPKEVDLRFNRLMEQLKRSMASPGSSSKK